MMSRGDYEQIADVIFSLEIKSSIPQMSHGMYRRKIALVFARRFEGGKWFDKEAFMMRAENGV